MHNCFTDENELRSTKEDKSECAIKKQKYAKDEVPYDVTNYSNAFHVFECGRNLLDRLDVSYERACMSIHSTISDSAYYDSKEQVGGKNKSEEEVDTKSDYKEQVDVVSKGKAYKDYSF